MKKNNILKLEETKGFSLDEIIEEIKQLYKDIGEGKIRAFTMSMENDKAGVTLSKGDFTAVIGLMERAKFNKLMEDIN